MRILLIHKSDAGDGSHAMDAVIRSLEQVGHTVIYCRRRNDWVDALSAGPDLALIAGGDGTVARVVRKLIGTGIPFAIVPLGTANNIATELGWGVPAHDIATAIEQAQPVPFTVGVARGPWGVEHFLEGVGVGPFTSAMSFAKAQKSVLLPPPENRLAKLHRDLQLVQAFLTEGRAMRWQLELDGEHFDGDYLLIEVMNTGRVGPGLELAPDADHTDDVLDVVMVGEPQRGMLNDYLDQRQKGPSPPPSLPVRRARHVRMAGESARVHIDDDVWPEAGLPPPPVGTMVEIEVHLERRLVTALVPEEVLVRP